MAAYAQTALQATLSTPLGADKLLLRAFSGEEAVSSLFHFDLEMRSEDPDVDFSQIVGKSATITLHLSDDGKRYVNGLVASFAYAGTSHQPGTDQGFALYHARLVPWLWILTLE